jgi:endonuclease/exonuclease/phosphatase (EEP) superfamily protein YafD
VRARRRSRGRRFWLVLSTLAALSGATLLLLALAPDLQARHQWLAMAASFAPYGWLMWLLAVLLALVATRGRARLVVLPLALGLAAHTLVLLPYIPDSAAASAGQSTVGLLAVNLRFGLSDLDQLVAEVDRADPDVVVLTEVTRSNAKVLARRAWRERLPYRLGSTGRDYGRRTGIGDASGTMVLARFPLAELGQAADTAFTNIAVRVDLPDHPFVLIAAHPANPERSLRPWLSDGQSLARLAANYAHESLVIAGDLNATAEHLTLRELEARANVTDTATGRGWHPTFPADRWFPPLIQIDHVLASAQFTATSLETFKVAGSDHLGLLVRLAVS